MKKFSILALALVLVFGLSLGLASCDNDEVAPGETATPTVAPPTPTQAPTPTEEPTPTLEPTPTPEPPAMTEVFSDDFSGDMSKWTEAFYGDWRIEDGSMHVNSVDGGPKIGALGTDFSDFILESEITFGEHRDGEGNYADIGFIFRASDLANGADSYRGYYVGISHHARHVIVGKANNDWTELATEHVDVEYGDTVTVRLVVTGDVFEFYVNGEFILDWEDTSESEPFTSGMIGLRSWQMAGSYGFVRVLVPEAA